MESTVFEVQMVVRLGGFYLLMSYRGSIGKIMEGSGIRDILSLIYAEGSVDTINIKWTFLCTCSASPHQSAAGIRTFNNGWIEKWKRWISKTIRGWREFILLSFDMNLISLL